MDREEQGAPLGGQAPLQETGERLRDSTITHGPCKKRPGIGWQASGHTTLILFHLSNLQLRVLRRNVTEAKYASGRQLAFFINSYKAVHTEPSSLQLEVT